MFMISIQEKLRAIMKATGKKQMLIAEQFNVSQSTVNRWLAGAEPEGHRRDAINEAYEAIGLDSREADKALDPLIAWIVGNFLDKPESQKQKAIEMLSLLKDATPDQTDMAIRIVRGVLGG